MHHRKQHPFRELRDPVILGNCDSRHLGGSRGHGAVDACADDQIARAKHLDPRWHAIEQMDLRVKDLERATQPSNPLSIGP
eukprot:scaffold2213_cov143-Isochrysis_galbana.AAC.4